MTADEIIALIVAKIGHIYERPLMYGGNAEGVDSLLFVLHSLWSEATGRIDEFEQARATRCDTECCNAMSFAGYYQGRNPSALEPEITAFVVSQWRAISENIVGFPRLNAR
jgi:hypothetical protein